MPLIAILSSERLSYPTSSAAENQITASLVATRKFVESLLVFEEGIASQVAREAETATEDLGKAILR
jgi:hypothetical protein